MLPASRNDLTMIEEVEGNPDRLLAISACKRVTEILGASTG